VKVFVLLANLNLICLQWQKCPPGTSLTTVCKLLGGTIFVSISEILYSSKLRDLFVERLPELDPGVLDSESSIELRVRLEKVLLPTLVFCSNDALQ
jgi:hypothetical protein